MVDSAQYIIDEESLESARNFLIQFLRDSGYTGSVEDGTSIHDTVIKPMSLLLSVMRQDQEKTKAYLSLAEAERLKDHLGEDYDDAVDAILSNWFVSRKGGTTPQVTFRLYFTAPLEFFELKTTTKVATIDKVEFYPDTAYTLYTSDFTSVVYGVENTLMYYVDITATAKTPLDLSDTNISGYTVKGTLPGIYFYAAELLDIKKSGSLREDSESFIRRTKDAVTTRELITDKAKKTVIMDEYPEVRDVYVAGYGDPEQLRDIVEFQDLIIHTGNKSDIFIQSGIVENSQEFVLAGDLLVDLSGLGALEVVAITNKDNGGEYTWDVQSWSGLTAGSRSDSLIVSLSGASSGDVVQVRYLTGRYLPSVTAMVTGAEQRVGCYDPLVKEKFPVILSTNIELEYDRNALATKTLSQMETETKASIFEYVTSCLRLGDFSVSSLISFLHSRLSYVTRVNTPLEVSYSLRDPEDFVKYTGAVTSTIAIPVAVSNQFSTNTVQLFTDNSRIAITWV